MLSAGHEDSAVNVLENGRRCRGHCCRKFFLPFSPDELVKQARLAWRKDPAASYGWRAFATIVHMVIPIGPTKDGYFYTCCYYDDVSRNCLIWSHRPNMCSEYPYGNACRYSLCADKTTLEKINWLLWKLEWRLGLVADSFEKLDGEVKDAA